MGGRKAKSGPRENRSFCPRSRIARDGYKDCGKAVNVPLVRPPTGFHKYGASYGQLRAINRDFISKLATPRYAGYCVIPNWSSNSMQRDSGESQGRYVREEWLCLFFFELSSRYNKFVCRIIEKYVEICLRVPFCSSFYRILISLSRSRVGSPTMSATVAGNQQQQHPHQEWDINDSNVPRVISVRELLNVPSRSFRYYPSMIKMEYSK